LSASEGLSLRLESLCSAVATISLPLPDSPSINTGKGESAHCEIWLRSFCIAALRPMSIPASTACGAEISAARNCSACSRMRLRFSGSHGLATNSAAPSARACRAFAASFCPESTRIFTAGECASRSPISANPSSGRCGTGGSPRSTSATCGGWSS